MTTSLISPSTAPSNFTTTPTTSHALSAISTLQKSYNPTTGLWLTTGWWNAANILTTLADFTNLDSSLHNITYPLFAEVYEKAQVADVRVWKEMGGEGVRSRTSISINTSSEVHVEGFPGFINEYYDDEGWWALAWLKVYDLTNDTRYLNTAVSLFSDMQQGRNEHCGGGIYWNKAHAYTGAIENELFFSVAASLANIPTLSKTQREKYLDIATKQLDWFINTGMLNEQNLINNGIDAETCRNDGGTVWTYNQGVILGGLVQLWKATNVGEYVDLAEMIALAVIEHLTDSNGILHEPCEPDCGADGGQFKGIFVRNLHRLWAAGTGMGRADGYERAYDRFERFMVRNTESIWNNGRGEGDELGLVWSGPFDEGRADAGTQGSALDALVAAVAVEKHKKEGVGREDEVGL